MPTRSTALAEIHQPAGAGAFAFVVPNGYTYLLKDLRVNNGTGANTAFGVTAFSASGLVGVPLLSGTLVPNAPQVWQGWMAFNPGDSLVVSSATQAVDLWASGAKLPGVA